VPKNQSETYVVSYNGLRRTLSLVLPARAQISTPFAPAFCPGGTFESSPAFQRRDQAAEEPRPEGTAEEQRPPTTDEADATDKKTSVKSVVKKLSRPRALH